MSAGEHRISDGSGAHLKLRVRLMPEDGAAKARCCVEGRVRKTMRVARANQHGRGFAGKRDRSGFAGAGARKPVYLGCSPQISFSAPPWVPAFWREAGQRGEPPVKAANTYSMWKKNFHGTWVPR